MAVRPKSKGKENTLHDKWMYELDSGSTPDFSPNKISIICHENQK